MCDSQVIRRTRTTLPSLLSILKDFPVQQYVQAGHFYHSISMRVLFSWTQLRPEHEINLRGAPYELVKTLPCWYLWQMWSAKAGSRSLTKFKVDED